VVNIVLALQGGAANCSEATFCGQSMQRNVSLFLSALGFPPDGFWLCRRAASPGDQRIPPPPPAAQAQTEATAQAAMQGELITEVNEVDQQEAVPLGNAQWIGLREATPCTSPCSRPRGHTDVQPTSRSDGRTNTRRALHPGERPSAWPCRGPAAASRSEGAPRPAVTKSSWRS
jgi:hypothetical protein